MPADIQKIIDVKSNAEAWLLKIPDVTGVAVGLKQINKEPVPGDLVIVVFVEKKKRKEEVLPAELIPAEINGVKTDVLQSGKMYLLSNTNIGGQEVESDANKEGGTLGCFAKVSAGVHSGKTVLLTNQHVLFNGQDVTPFGDKVGNICSFCSPCCSDYIGITLDAELNSQMDAAIAQLTPGTKYLPEVKNFGPIKGEHIFAPNDLAALLPVKKYGVKTEETHGILQHGLWSGPIMNHGGSLHGVFSGMFNIYPVVTGPGNPIFTEGGDSGSVVLLEDNKVLGLLMAGPKDPDNINHGIVCPINPITTRFKLTIETSDHTGDVRTVPGVAPAIAEPQPLIAGMNINTAGRLHMLAREQERILATRNGKFYYSFFKKHSTEIRLLINKNKTVARAWHRNRGPGILNLLVQYIENKFNPFPQNVNGRAFSECIVNIAAVFKKFGSGELAADCITTEKILPEIEKMGYEDFFSRHIVL